MLPKELKFPLTLTVDVSAVLPQGQVDATCVAACKSVSDQLAIMAQGVHSIDKLVQHVQVLGRRCRGLQRSLRRAAEAAKKVEHAATALPESSLRPLHAKP